MERNVISNTVNWNVKFRFRKKKIFSKENSKYVQNGCSLFTVPDYVNSGGN